VARPGPSPLVAAASPGGRLLAARWGASVPAGRRRAGEPLPHHAGAAADAASPERILVVARCVPRAHGPLDERRVDDLLGDLAALRPDCRLTLLAADGHDAGRRAPRLLARGVEVAAGPEDWEAWFDARALGFTHVVSTDPRATGRIEDHLSRTQPTARRVLYPPSLPFRDLASLQAAGTPAAEADGFRLVARLAEERLARRVTSFDALWCASRADRDWMVGAAPGTPCTVLPAAARRPTGPDRGFAGRSGYVVLAAWGHDVVAAHEDAARHAVREVLPGLVARDPTAVVRLVTDEPTPGLQALAGPHVQLVAAGDDPARWFRRARVCLATYPHGAGARDALALALDAGTPFATAGPAALEGELRGLAPMVAAADPAAAAARLHDDRSAWEAAHRRLADVALGARSRTAARTALVRALADVGVVPERAAPLDEAPMAQGDGPPVVLRPRRVPLLGTATPPSADEPPHGRDEQYRRWRERFGPTPERLAAVTRRVEALGDGPVVSVVMPVFNSDPAWLDEAVASVRAQLYGRWELCVGDDASTRRETAAVLDRHGHEDPRVRVVRLPGPEGVAGASNAALAHASGPLVAFLDHHDLLPPHALAEVALAAAADPDVDLLYTDEDALGQDGRLVEPLFKPDWSPDLLMSRDYVGHLLVVRRALLDKLGGLRRGYDGGHHHDLVLRAAELTDRVAHLPEP
ncbi:MAG: glycosyltransferase, partial [Acidimicrobiia bacterium]